LNFTGLARASEQNLAAYKTLGGYILATTLKDLTWESHIRAEKTPFMKRMLKKQISPREYYIYLSNQLAMYHSLEYYAEQKQLFHEIEDIKRVFNIQKDLLMLEKQHGFTVPGSLKSTENYINYISEIQNDPDKLMAHMYVRYFGDLSGGQIIRKLVPGTTYYYDFDCDVNALKMKFAQKLDVSLAEEANVCFQMVTEFLNELEIFLADKTMG